MTETTLDLLDRAVRHSDSERALSRSLGLADNTLSTARQKGRLSPGIAAALAAHMGESVLIWTLVAVQEGERSEAIRTRLADMQAGFERAAKKAAHEVRNS